MTTFLNKEHHSYSMTGPANLNRKKIKHFSYSSSDRIGKGYSSVVYRGKNDQTGNKSSTQIKPSPSKPSTWKESKMQSAEKC